MGYALCWEDEKGGVFPEDRDEAFAAPGEMEDIDDGLRDVRSPEGGAGDRVVEVVVSGGEIELGTSVHLGGEEFSGGSSHAETLDSCELAGEN